MPTDFIKKIFYFLFALKRHKCTHFKDRFAVIRAFVILSFKHRFFKKTTGDVSFNLFGFTIYGISYFNLPLLVKEIFWVKEYYFETDNPEPKIIDCGANIGMAVLYFKHLYPNARIIAFEPNPHAFRILQKNIQVNKLQNVQAYNLGISSEKGEIDFYLAEHDKGSLRGAIIESRGGKESISIKTEKLSDYLKKDQFDLVKIDVEGAEWGILQDLSATNTFSKTEQFIIEYHHNVAGQNNLFSDFLRPFEQYGFDYKMISSWHLNEDFQDIVIYFYKKN